MADDVHVELSPDLDAEVARLVAAGDEPMAIAKQIASIARASAPVASGDYAASIRAEKTRGGARVFAADPKSALIEFGVPSQGQPAKFNLRRAVDAAGLKFKKKGS